MTFALFAGVGDIRRVTQKDCLGFRISSGRNKELVFFLLASLSLVLHAIYSSSLLLSYDLFIFLRRLYQTRTRFISGSLMHIVVVVYADFDLGSVVDEYDYDDSFVLLLTDLLRRQLLVLSCTYCRPLGLLLPGWHCFAYSRTSKV